MCKNSSRVSRVKATAKSARASVRVNAEEQEAGSSVRVLLLEWHQGGGH